MHIQTAHHDSPTASSCPVLNEVRLIELTQEQIDKFMGECPIECKLTHKSIRLHYPNEVEMQFRCDDTIEFVYTLTNSYTKWNKNLMLKAIFWLLVLLIYAKNTHFHCFLRWQKIIYLTKILLLHQRVDQCCRICCFNLNLHSRWELHFNYTD